VRQALSLLVYDHSGRATLDANEVIEVGLNVLAALL